MTSTWALSVDPSTRSARLELDLGAGLHLRLDERRLAMRRTDHSAVVALTGARPPAGLAEVLLRLNPDEGPASEVSFDPAPDLRHTVAAPGRLVDDPQPVELSIGWRFAARRFRPARTRWWTRHVLLDSWDARSVGLGGLTPSTMHHLCADAGVMWLGSGHVQQGIEAIAAGDRRGPLRSLRMAPTDHLVRSGSSVHVFAADGRHIRTVDPIRRRDKARFHYDEQGRLTAWYTVETGTIASIDRGDDPRRLRVSSRGEPIAGIELDDDGRVVTVELPDTPPLATRYGSDGLIATATGTRNEQVEVEHDDDGAVTSWVHSSGQRLDLVHHRTEDGHRTVLMTGAGRETSIESAVTGNVRRRSWRCCGAEQPSIAVADRDVETVTQPDGSVERTTRWQERTDAGHRSVTRISRRTPAGRTSTTVIERSSTANEHRQVTTVDGRTWTTVHDSETGTTTTTSPAGRVDTIVSTREALTQQRAGGHAHTTEFVEGRPQRTIDGDHVVSYEHDERGRLSAVTSGDERRLIERDTAGRLHRVQLEAGWLTIDRDTAGDVSLMTTPRGAEVRFERADDGLVTTVTGPSVGDDGPAVHQHYDHDRMLIARSIEGGARVEFTHDAVGRVTRTASANIDITHDYDPASGLRRAASTPDHTLRWERDGRLVLAEHSEGIVEGSVRRTFGTHGFAMTTLHVDDVDLSVDHDVEGAISGIGPVRVHRHAESGLPSRIAVGETLTTRTYDGAGRLVEQRSVFRDQVLLAERIERDARGRVIRVIETTEASTRTFGFEYAGDALAEATVDGQTMYRVERDEGGNPVAVTSGHGTWEATYDAADRMTAFDGRPAHYDSAGRLVDDGQRQYRYDDLDRLVGVKGASAEVVQVFDALGRLVEARADGRQFLEVLWAGSTPAAVTGPTGSRRVCAATGYAVAPEALIDGGQVLRLITDHRGSVRLVVDAPTGETLQTLDYDPFGARLIDSNPGFQPFGFTGAIHDPYTGLVHLRARTLQPSSGRFLTSDPIGFDGGQINLYLYAGGDPVNRTDPAGMQSTGGGQVQVCTAPFVGSRDSVSLDHVFIKTEDWSRGQGIGNDSAWYEKATLQTEWVDERTNNAGKDKPTTEGQECRPVEGVDEECLRDYTKPGTHMGTYGIGYGGGPNICYDAVYDALDACASEEGWRFSDDGGDGDGLGDLAHAYEIVSGATRPARTNIRDGIRTAVEVIVDWVYGD